MELGKTEIETRKFSIKTEKDFNLNFEKNLYVQISIEKKITKF